MDESDRTGVRLEREPSGNRPAERAAEGGRRDQDCWLCGSAVVVIHCKVVCENCGFRRDCSDP